MIVQATRKCRSQHCGHLEEIGDPRQAVGPATEHLGGVSPTGAAIECSACMGPTEVVWRMEDGTYAERVALTSQPPEVALTIPRGVITTRCPYCEKLLRAKSGFAGRQVKCSACGKPVIIPKEPKNQSDASARSLKKRRRNPKVEEIISRLSSPSVRERRDACYEAAMQPLPAVAKALIQVLALYPYPQFNANDNEFYCTVKGAAYALGCIQEPSTVGFLLEAIGWDADQPNLNIYTWGISARAGLREAKTPFAQSVIDKYDSGATVEPKLLRHFRRQIPTLISKLQDASLPTGERMESCFALAMTKDSRVVPPLVKSLEVRDIEVRRIAAYALAKIGDRSALGALKQAWKVARELARQSRKQFFGMTVIGATPADRLVKTLRSAVLSMSPWRMFAHAILCWVVTRTLMRGEDFKNPHTFLRENSCLLIERF